MNGSLMMLRGRNLLLLLNMLMPVQTDVMLIIVFKYFQMILDDVVAPTFKRIVKQKLMIVHYIVIMIGIHQIVMINDGCFIEP